MWVWAGGGGVSEKGRHAYVQGKKERTIRHSIVLSGFS